MRWLSFFVTKHTPFFTSFALIFLAFFSKGLGFLKEVIVSHLWGASVLVDGYIMSFTIMHLCTIWVQGFLSYSVPFLVGFCSKKGEAALSNFVGRLLLLGVLGALCIPALVLFKKTFFISIFFPGASSEALEVALGLMGFLWGFGAFRILSFVLESYFQALDLQLLARVGWALQTFVLVCVLLLGASWMGLLAWPLGLSLGQLVTFLLLASVAFFVLSPERRPVVRKGLFEGFAVWRSFAVRGTPGVLMCGQSVIYQIVDRYFASLLSVGSLACMNYATVLWGLTALLNEPLAPLLTRFSVHYAKDDMVALQSDMEKAIRATLWLFVTFTVGFVVLLPDVVGLVFVHGQFTFHDAVRTYQGARILAFQAPAICLGSILSHMILASGASHVSMIFSACTLTLNGLLDWLLVEGWGLNGLLFATTVATYVGAVLAYMYVRWRFSWSLRRVGGYVYKLLVWSWATGSVGWVVRQSLPLSSSVAACITVVVLFLSGYVLYRFFALRTEIPTGWSPEDILSRVCRRMLFW
ncbi:MAG: hypothetical protein CSA35_02315 [Dethiosulfovibrio peptidovorans]|nr:MAG: hypothetical protein CSA35_02315 [Dethiosulfovibrio peptidovorans]